jgi:hypothetical protein
MPLKSEVIAIMIIGGIFGIFTTINSVAVYADTTSGGCDPTLWDHVFHPARLHTLKTCMTVSGIIDHIKREPDGDLHIRVHLDPQYSNLTNSANDQIQAGDLVIEPVCDHEPTQSNAAIEACSGFQSQIVIPPKGTHIQTTGRYVLDTSPNHGWTEIHPVSNITNLDSSPSFLSLFGIHTSQPLQQHIIPSQRQHVPYDDIPDKSE